MTNKRRGNREGSPFRPRGPRRFSVAWWKYKLWTSGMYITAAIMYCPGCGMQTRWVRKARAHECTPDRAGKRRIERAAKKRSTAHV